VLLAEHDAVAALWRTLWAAEALLEAVTAIDAAKRTRTTAEAVVVTPMITPAPSLNTPSTP